MFGTLRPHSCSLDEGARNRHMHYYCGLCQSLGLHFGLPFRGLVNHDAVFLAMLADGLTPQPADPHSCRCPLLPVLKKPTVSPHSPAMRLAAATQVLLADQRLADWQMEGRRGAGLLRRLVSEAAADARQMLTDDGVDVSGLEGFERQQQRVESPGQSPRRAAEPTAAALAHLFSQLARVPGLAPSPGEPQAGPQPEPNGRPRFGDRALVGWGSAPPANSGAEPHPTQDRCRVVTSGFDLPTGLAQLGRSVGTGIYLLDALEDVQRDYRRGAFNPCVEPGPGGPRISPRRLAQSRQLLGRSMEQIAASLAALPLERNRRLLENVLLDALPGQLRQQTRRSRALTALRCEDLRSQRQRPWPRRLLHQLWLALALVWTLLTTTTVHLPPSIRQRWQRAGEAWRRRERSLSARAATSFGALIGLDQCPCSDCGNCGNCCDGCKPDKCCDCDNCCSTDKCCDGCNPGKCCDCSDACKPDKCCNTKDCCDLDKCCPCKDCANDCSKTCNDCGKPCEQCSDSCGKQCETCGKCAKDCEKSSETCRESSNAVCSNCFQFDVKLDPTPFMVMAASAVLATLGILVLVIWLVVRAVRRRRAKGKDQGKGPGNGPTTPPGSGATPPQPRPPQQPQPQPRPSQQQPRPPQPPGQQPRPPQQPQPRPPQQPQPQPSSEPSQPQQSQPQTSSATGSTDDDKRTVRWDPPDRDEQ